MKVRKSAPPFCSSCFQQNSELTYIDFEAAYDGPVIPGSPVISVDDLNLCERCLNAAFALLDPQGTNQENERLLDALELAEAEIAKKDQLIVRMERTLSEIIDHPVETSHGVQHYAGVRDEVRQYLNTRRRKRNQMTEYAKKGGAATKAKREAEKAAKEAERKEQEEVVNA